MDKYWVWLSYLYKIGPKAQNELLKEYKTPEKIWNLSKKELEKNNFLNNEQKETILNKQIKENIHKYIDYMEKNGIELITINDEEYPHKLKNIYDPPVVLYIRGNKKLLKETSIAVIGSRICSQYGTNTAKKFAYELAKNNIIVVSGMARGIDTYAHIGTLSIENSTIAVTRMWIRYSLSKRKQKTF